MSPPAPIAWPRCWTPDDRRYRYPFTNCTNCGPRFSIIEALPYDRPNTTMRRFSLCPACQAEYDNPLDRRFHAQPNACPACGPTTVRCWTKTKDERPTTMPPLHPTFALVLRHHAQDDEALVARAELFRAGKILAVKGLGGFHLMVDARNSAAINRLRERKLRHEKPFAIMAPDLDQTRLLCEVSAEAATLLASAEAPIVLMQPESRVAGDVSSIRLSPRRSRARQP